MWKDVLSWVPLEICQTVVPQSRWASSVFLVIRSRYCLQYNTLLYTDTSRRTITVVYGETDPSVWTCLLVEVTAKEKKAKTAKCWGNKPCDTPSRWGARDVKDASVVPRFLSVWPTLLSVLVSLFLCSSRIQVGCCRFFLYLILF